MLTIGFLLPRSTLFPSLGLDILNGLRCYLEQEQAWQEITPIMDNIGFGVEEGEIYTRAEKMLLQDNADIVIVCADTRIAELLHPLFTSVNKILLVVNFGTNVPENRQAAPTTLLHSLNFCMHAGLTGRQAAEGPGGKEAVYLLSYYDAGYQQCYWMMTAHQLAGGIPAFNHITALHLQEFSLEPLKGFLDQHPGVSTLLCLFAGDQAERFYREISPVQKKYGLHLFGAPMLFEPSLKKTLGKDFTVEGITGNIPWHPSLDNKGNSAFLSGMAGKPGSNTNYFSVLGWEAGMIVKEILSLYHRMNGDAAAITRSLTDLIFESPRGRMRIDPHTYYTYAPSYRASCSGNMDIIITGEEDMETAWKEFVNQPPVQGDSSGWRNTYLCI